MFFVTTLSFLKWLFIQKWKLSLFTHPQVVLNLYGFFVVLNTKEDILKNVGNKQLLVHIDLRSMGSLTVFKIFFLWNRRKKLIQVWNNFWNKLFILGWTIPLTPLNLFLKNDFNSPLDLQSIFLFVQMAYLKKSPSFEPLRFWKPFFIKKTVTLQFRDQFLLLSSCLLACILLA